MMNNSFGPCLVSLVFLIFFIYTFLKLKNYFFQAPTLDLLYQNRMIQMLIVLSLVLMMVAATDQYSQADSEQRSPGNIYFIVL